MHCLCPVARDCPVARQPSLAVSKDGVCRGQANKQLSACTKTGISGERTCDGGGSFITDFAFGEDCG